MASPQEAPASADPTVAPEALRRLLASSSPRSADATPMGEVSITPGEPGRLKEVRLVDAPLARAADALNRAAQVNVIVSRPIQDQRVSITLRDLDVRSVLEAIAVAQGLVCRRDEASGMYVLARPDELFKGLAAFQSHQTQVFTLLYPNATDVARAIGDLFGERVIVAEQDDDADDGYRELQDRFRRFDLVESRSRGLSGSAGGTSVTTTTGSNSTSSSNTTRHNSGRSGGAARIARPQSLRDEQRQLTAQEQRSLAQAAASGQEESYAQAEQVAMRNTLTYVTVIKRLNRLVVRSANPGTLEEIRQLIQRLDVPTPLVLLEVRVLRIDLSDGLDYQLDVAFQSGDAQGAFSGGEIARPLLGSVLPGGTGVNLRAGVFQVVSDHVQARLQLLQSKGRVTALATPMLLTTHGEVSRIFSGEQIPVVVGFTEPQVITGTGATTTLAATPVTELRDVGTDLLITANVNADRTVTLRLLQETSSVKKNGASILVPAGNAFISTTIDTVASQSASGTIVARDGMTLAFGGLIEEVESDTREQLPLLGDLPLVGFLFRRENARYTRNELVVLVRPYVLTTPVEGEAISRDLLESLSLHPYRPAQGDTPAPADDLGTFRSRPPRLDQSLFDAFRYHSSPPIEGNRHAPDDQ